MNKHKFTSLFTLLSAVALSVSAWAQVPTEDAAPAAIKFPSDQVKYFTNEAALNLIPTNGLGQNPWLLAAVPVKPTKPQIWLSFRNETLAGAGTNIWVLGLQRGLDSSGTNFETVPFTNVVVGPGTNMLVPIWVPDELFSVGAGYEAVLPPTIRISRIAGTNTQGSILRPGSVRFIVK